MSASVDLGTRRHRLTVGDYYNMAKTGILKIDDRVELIEGEIIDMTPIGSRHAATVDRLNHLILPTLASRAIVRVQQPVGLSDWSELVPDIAVVAFRSDFYESAHPTPADIRLLIEVADSSLAYDRDFKLPLYARHGIREVWLLDIEAKALRIFRSPVGNAYEQSFAAPDLHRMVIESIADTPLDLSIIFARDGVTG
jgi:Uma2 family endonuclease